MSSNRQLAAIMFTDIQGYTAMMQDDESLAIKSVKRFEDVITKLVPEHHGEVVQHYGDGCLTIFGSATSALSCAMELQTELSAGFRVPLRAGIHMGEIVRDGERVFGDGVNIASRIESVGVSGGVVFSQSIYQQIRNNRSFEVCSLGDYQFKNVKGPMQVFAIANPGFNVPDASTRSATGKGESVRETSILGQVKRLFRRPGKSMERQSTVASGSVEGHVHTDENSIIVLPFDNLSGLPDQDQFVMGIADEIRSQLLGIKELKVISRQSSRSCKDRKLSLKQIGQEMKVANVLNGRVQKIGQAVKVSVELSNTTSNSVIWAPPPEQREMSNMFDLEHDIAKGLIEQLKLELSPEQEAKLSESPTTNADAYEYFKNGQELLHRGGGKIAELDEARRMFEFAIKLDPNFARAYVGLSDTLLEYVFWGRKAVNEVMSEALSSAFKALELDDSSGPSYGTLGAINFYRQDIGTSQTYLEKAIDLTPSYLQAYDKLSWMYSYHGREQDALDILQQAYELDPLSSKFIGDKGHIFYWSREFGGGIELLKETLEIHPNDNWLLWMLGYLYAGNGDYDAAIETYQRRSAASKTNWMLGYSLGMAGQMDEARRVLDYQVMKREDGHVPAYMIATICMGIGEYEQALDWLEKDFNEGALGLFFLGLRNDIKFDPVRDEPRFKKLLSRIKA